MREGREEAGERRWEPQRMLRNFDQTSDLKGSLATLL